MIKVMQFQCYNVGKGAIVKGVECGKAEVSEARRLALIMMLLFAHQCPVLATL